MQLLQLQIGHSDPNERNKGALTKDALPKILHQGFAFTCNVVKSEMFFQTSPQGTCTAHTHPPILLCPPDPARLPTILKEVGIVTLIGQLEERADLVEAIGELGGKVRKRYNL